MVARPCSASGWVSARDGGLGAVVAVVGVRLRFVSRLRCAFHGASPRRLET
jgi:hypothetical protein